MGVSLFDSHSSFVLIESTNQQPDWHMYKLWLDESITDHLVLFPVNNFRFVAKDRISQKHADGGLVIFHTDFT